MSGSQRVKLWPRKGGLLVILLVVAAFLAACSDGKVQAVGGAPAQVSAASVLVKSVRQWDQFSGRIAALESVSVRARVSGYIERIAFKEGAQVKAGELLFVIDPRPYQASYDSAQAQLARARAAAQLARMQHQRAQKLIVANAISREEFDMRRAALTQTAADVSAAEAQASAAKLNLEFTQVRSPIDGRISRAMLTVGNLVQADQSVLSTVVSQESVYIYFQPDEQSYLRYQRQARSGQAQSSDSPVRVGLADDTAYPYEGTLNFVNNQVDSATGTITLRAIVPNPNAILIPGLYARVQLQAEILPDAVLIDDKAVMTDQDRKYVYVVGPKNEALRKDVKLGGYAEGLRIVESGLDREDKVIVGGLQRIFSPGMPVQVTEVLMGASQSSTGQKG